MLAHYYAATTFMDAQVGKVLDQLKATGLDKNTIVVLFGDQGYCLGERDGFFAKGNLWEGSLHVPLIVATPDGARAGQACRRPVQLMDMYPTLVDLCGLQAPDTPQDGESFRPLLGSEQASWRDWAVSYNHNKKLKALDRTIRTPRYRYTERADGTAMELTDHQADPWGWTNLVDDPAHEKTRAELARLLRKAQGA